MMRMNAPMKRRSGPLPFLPRGKKRKVDKSKSKPRLIISGAPRKPGELVLGQASGNSKPRSLTMKDLRKMRREQRKADKLKRSKSGLKSLKEAIEAQKKGIVIPEDLARREAEMKAHKLSASLGASNIQSSNLHIGNVPSHISEKEFISVFAGMGEITSVRFMTGRKDSNHAFCNYKTREEAENAVRILRGRKVWGAYLDFDWGHKLESTPGTYGSNPLQWISTPSEPSDPINRNKYYSHQRFPKSEFFPPLGHPRVQVRFPKESRKRQIIDCLAEHVSTQGMAFENHVISQICSLSDDQGNHDFAFLLAVDSAEHMYYRWRLWSLAMGESLDKWTPEPFQMMDGGPFWIPPSLESRKLLNADPSTLPKINAMPPRPTTTQPRPVPTNPFDMNECQRTQLFEHLQLISPTRKKVRTVMHYCVSNFQHAQEICEILEQSMSTKKLNLQRKLARLYLMNDLVFNSQMSKSGKPFRGHLKQKLEAIFTYLHDLLDDLEDANQKSFHAKVVEVLDVWEKNTLYTKPYLDRLRKCFLNGGSKEGVNTA